MKLIASNRSIRLQRGMSARSFVMFMAVSIVVLAGLGVTFWYINFRSDARLEIEIRKLENQRQIAEIELKKGTEQGRLALARNRLNEALVRARQVTNSLAVLLQDIESLNRELSELKTNDIGKSVALHPDLRPSARRLYESDLPQLPASSEVMNKLESARRVEQQLVDHLGTAYEPDAQWTVNLQDSGYWAEATSRRLQQIRSLRDSLVRDAKVKIPAQPLDDKSGTLNDELKKLAEGESAQRQQQIITKTDAASKQAIDAVAKAHAKDIIERAMVESNRIVQNALEEFQKFAREKQIREAEQRKQDIDAELAAKKVLTEADKKLFSDKASRPEVQAKLAPFITKGFWTTKTRGNNYDGSLEKKPLSYNEIKGAGALDETFAGLQKLVDIASNRNNDRPRWDNMKERSPDYWKKVPEKLQLAKDAQKLLIELGPTLVEMKLLSE